MGGRQGNSATAATKGKSNMPRNNNKAAATVAAKQPAIVRAANAIGRHGLAATTRLSAAGGVAAASAARYAKGSANVAASVNALSPNFAAATFSLTALGKNAVAVNGCIGSKGNATAMGLTACGLGNAGGTATGAQVAAAILGNAALVNAMLTLTKASGTHVIATAPLAARWVQGYVNGLCRPQHGLATRS
jgi:hypothetical protein